jgi:hypothetical protein
VNPLENQVTAHRQHGRDGLELQGSGGQDFSVEWHHAFGSMVIEVRSGVVMVDGEVVHPSGTSTKWNALRSA